MSLDLILTFLAHLIPRSAAPVDALLCIGTTLRRRVPRSTRLRIFRYLLEMQLLAAMAAAAIQFESRILKHTRVNAPDPSSSLSSLSIFLWVFVPVLN